MFGKLLKEYRMEHGLSTEELAEIVGVHRTSIAGWEQDKFKPTNLSIAKVARALGWKTDLRLRVLMMNDEIIEDRLTLQMEDYDIIRELEDRYGSMSLVPNDDPLLFKLHKRLGVETERSQGYSRDKVEKLRKKHGFTMKEVSMGLGYSSGWYANTFNKGTPCTLKQAKMFAKFFDVDLEVLEE